MHACSLCQRHATRTCTAQLQLPSSGAYREHTSLDNTECVALVLCNSYEYPDDVAVAVAIYTDADVDGDVNMGELARAASNQMLPTLRSNAHIADIAM